jgi:hypothetical protein
MVGPELFLLNKRAIYQDYSFFQKNLSNWLSDGLPGDGPGRARGFLRGVEHYGWNRRMIPFLAYETHSIVQFLNMFFGVMLLKRNKKMWGEKLPDNVNCIFEFLHVYPKGKIIHLVRDGRDVAASLLKRKISIPFAAESWLYANARAMEWKNDERFLLVKYEDLVTGPRDNLRAIQQHLEVKSHDLIELRSKNSYWKKIIRSEEENIHQEWSLNPLFSPISTSSIGGFKKYLAPHDLEQFTGFTANKSKFTFPTDSPESVQEMLQYFGY